MKSIGVAAFAAAGLLAVGGCGAAGTVGASKASGVSSGATGASGASGTKSPGASSASSSAAAESSSSAGSGDSSSASASASASASSAGGGSGTALTTDQISKILLTDKDDPGYVFDASKDDTTTADSPETVSAGGSVCQTFVDAQEALSTKYGTTAEVDRQLTKEAEGHAIQDSVMVLPSADKALALVADLNAGIKGCSKLSMAQEDGSTTGMVISPIPQLIGAKSAGYIDYLTISGKTVLMAAEVLPVGNTVSVVALVGPVTSDTTVLEQMGATLGHLSNVQAGRLKGVLGVGGV